MENDNNIAHTRDTDLCLENSEFSLLQKNLDSIEITEKDIYFELKNEIFKGLKRKVDNGILTEKEQKKNKDYFVRFLFNELLYPKLDSSSKEKCVPYDPGRLFKKGYVPYHSVLHCADFLDTDNQHLIPILFNAFGYIYKENGGKITPTLRAFIYNKVDSIKNKSKLDKNKTEIHDLFSILTPKSKEILKTNIQLIKNHKDNESIKNISNNLSENLKYDQEKSNKKRGEFKTSNSIIADYIYEYEDILFTYLPGYKKIPGKQASEREWEEIALSSIKNNNPKQNNKKTIDRKLLFLLVFVLELDRKETETLFQLSDCFLDKEGKYLVEDKILWELLPFLHDLKKLAVKMFAKKLASFDKIEYQNSSFQQTW